MNTMAMAYTMNTFNTAYDDHDYDDYYGYLLQLW